jgi:hypothetical protein
MMVIGDKRIGPKSENAKGNVRAKLKRWFVRLGMERMGRAIGTTQFDEVSKCICACMHAFFQLILKSKFDLCMHMYIDVYLRICYCVMHL